MDSAEKFLKSLVKSGKTPALHYLHFNSENIIYGFVDGFANIKNERKATDQTVFHACSVTKTFTALATLQLVEQGKITIESAVADYWPEFPYPGGITVHQLLSHTAGIPNPIPLSWIHLDTEHSAFDRNSFFKVIFNKHNRARSRPDEKFFYSNLGYVLLGQLIEKITGAPYEQFIFENIISKLSLRPDELGFTIDSHFRNATGYQKNRSLMNLLLGFFLNKSKFMDKREGNWKPFKTFYINGPSYGGLIGSAHSFRKYLQALLGKNNSLISEEYKRLLFTENYTGDNAPTGMCLSWFCGQFKGRKYFAHPGGGGGYYCEIRLYPEINRGSVIMFNRTGMSNEKCLDKVDKFFI